MLVYLTCVRINVLRFGWTLLSSFEIEIMLSAFDAIATVAIAEMGWLVSLFGM